MEAFYVSIIFLGVLLVIGSLFFIAMDKVNGKDFFKEFDRKKEEMFNLIQDSEEMVQELNRLSDYVVNVISDKNQEFFEKVKKSETANKAYNPYQASMAMSKVPRPVERVKAADIENNAAEISGSDNEDTLIPAIKESASQNAGEDNVQKIAARQKEVSKQKNASRQKEVSKQKDAFRQKDISEQKDTSQQRDISEQKDAAQQRDISEQKDAAQQRDIS
ncbi:MAG: hypothetical protein K0R50_2174, partial [Eubacterium sp.]|nr:hypothetical protein [Eubacterium sp.]